MVQWVQDQIRYMAYSTGLDEESTKIVMCLLLSFPLSALFKRLPDNKYTLKNLVVIGVSFFYIFIILELKGGFVTLLISTTFTYLITKYLKSDLMPWFNLAFLMGHLCINHLKAQFWQAEYDPTKIDITGAQMVLVMKLSSFAWSYRDGKLLKRDPKAFQEKLNTYQRSRVVVEHPSILSFLGYAFFFPSLLTGPSFDYSDYQNFINTELFSDVPDTKRPGKRRKRMIPKSGRIAFAKVVQGAAWAAIWITSLNYITTDYLFTVEYQQKPLIVKGIVLTILGFTYRLKYYAVWLISEGCCILVGIGYNGYDASTGKFYWNRVQNIAPWEFETGQNVRTCLEAWNMNTNKWLKNFIYLRSAKNNKPGFLSTLLTFATSAFWHGTKPGYYLSFVSGAFYQTIGKIFRRNIRPIFTTKDAEPVTRYKTLYDIVSWTVTHLAFGYLVQPFVILEFKKSIKVWSSVYFFPHIAIGIILFAFKGPFSRSVTGFLRKYHLKSKGESETISAPKKDTITVHPNASDASLIPEYDNQEELNQPIILPEIDFSKEDYDELMNKIDELQKLRSSKDFSLIENEEKQALYEALDSLSKDIGKVMGNIRSFKND
ncbi:Broad-specificity lysophospholipid acyltransferase [Komagataella phaffii CBS 7435]|uniref:Broad-specificity lysophospholipid acyltransferase n=1 Tax=Komagataella phaffii (strain ATCC 76273 / CBS 7435 / CECT 11047 / NRRL Y-11430 / Wegner 21-1) TaxID=981350 RepID=F2QWW8_KOMPC|nr:GQ67_03324T0 [Komagataella phaffii]AOA68967.1 GQ68_03293T0 [Komagataella phaffii GS115]CAH2449946.1 Broad-specificity lysophospholipid acyltransferase [Komagataella phaffii CBS 7435]CCA39896.1 Broad-specificity lysophospholipid acyltransferase [Komagataella phaffii CBS 7435]